MRLADVWAGRESARHVLVLVRKLGEGSRVAAAERGGEQYRGWTYERYINTLSANVLQLMLWVLTNQNAPQSKQTKQPTLLTTPDQPQQQRSRGMTLANFVKASFAAAARARNQQN